MDAGIRKVTAVLPKFSPKLPERRTALPGRSMNRANLSGLFRAVTADLLARTGTFPIVRMNLRPAQLARRPRRGEQDTSSRPWTPGRMAPGEAIITTEVP